MKQILLLLATASLLVANLSAQVTIGSAVKPNEGTLLDLKENDNLEANSTKGMLLPRVQLTTISSLDDIDASLNKDKHIGLTIYVPKEFENSCPGIYVWTGSNWEGLNTDESRAPDFITVNDIDGNEYTAKIFNRKGCKGGTYWLTSNLRTTRKNDGTSFHKPLYFTTGKALTLEEPFDEDNIVHFNQVRDKSDISTTEIITFYHNNRKVEMTQDAFVTKFGLNYTYHMAVARDGQAEEDVKICPEGWQVPVMADWVSLLDEVSGIPGVTGVGVPYLFANDDIYEPDGREIFAPENLDGEGFLNHGIVPGSWRVQAPKNMGGFPSGDSRNSGLNIYPSGSIRIHDFSIKSALDASFGSVATILEKRNGAIMLYAGREKLSGAAGSSTFPDETEYGNVRCIKVVE